jgi:hypothetical protein
MRLAMRTALLATLVTRVALIPVGLVALMVLGYAVSPEPMPPGSDLANLPWRWDAIIYLDIAQHGYRWTGLDQFNSPLVFFPAYPLLLRGAGRLLGLPMAHVPWVWTGVVLSTACFCAALAYVYALTNRLTAERSGALAVWLIACYPFSLFHGQVYTESLFLLAAVGACYHCYRGQWVAAFLFGCVVGLTRPTGVLVATMLAGFAWQHVRQRGRLHWREAAGLLTVVAAPVLGMLAYSAYVRRLTGHWFTWITAQQGWGREVTGPIDVISDLMASVNARGLTAYVFETPYEVGRPYDLLYLGLVVVTLVLLRPIIRRFGWGMGAFVFLSLALPVSAGGLTSVGRFTCVLFPVFMWLSTRTWATPLIVVFAIGQVVFGGLFYAQRYIF